MGLGVSSRRFGTTVLLVAMAVMAWQLPVTAGHGPDTSGRAKPSQKPSQSLGSQAWHDPRAAIPHALARGMPHRLSIRAGVEGARRARVKSAFDGARDDRPQTVSINPGRVTTVAGDGTNSNQDGDGAAAEFATMGGVVVLGGYAYVATATAIRRVDLTPPPSGHYTVTTVAGALNTSGCNPGNPQGSDARFTGLAGIETDGTYLYAIDPGCGNTVWKTQVGGTWTTTQLVQIGTTASYYDLTLASSKLYVVGTGAMQQVDPGTGSATTWPPGQTIYAYGVASDSTYLWLSLIWSCGNPCTTRLDRVTLSSGAVNTYDPPSGRSSMTGTGHLVSSGSYLFATTYGLNGAPNGLERITKPSGTPGGPCVTQLCIANIAGTADPDWADGTGTDAWLSGITGIGSDGTNLWVADGGNHASGR
jgi:hypothetical protein